MKSPVVLAYAGGIHASAAIPWLADTLGVEVVTVTLDVGQGHELAELRARALACGAVRAHAVDARDGFARDVLVPSLFTSEPADAPRPSISRLPWPLIARTLTEIARIEGAGGRAWLDRPGIRCMYSCGRFIGLHHRPGARVDDERRRSDRARARASSAAPTATPGLRIDQNMWGRSIAWEGDDEPSAVRAPRARGRVHEPALVDIHFERGMPTAVNGASMSPAELIDCLSLIGSQHRVGRRHVSLPGSRHVVHDAPAATILRAAAAEVGESGSADVCLVGRRSAHRAEPGRSARTAGELRVTLWSGRFDAAPDPAAFDFGVSFGFDRALFEDDVTGSLAWADALAAAGVLSDEDRASIVSALEAILEEGRRNPSWVAGPDEDAQLRRTPADRPGR